MIMAVSTQLRHEVIRIYKGIHQLVLLPDDAPPAEDANRSVQNSSTSDENIHWAMTTSDHVFTKHFLPRRT